jgi:hypothetical protein
MTTETTLEQHLRLRGHRPAIEIRKPIINDLPGALDDTGCLVERLRALLDSNVADLNELIVENAALPEALKFNAYTVWMIFLTIGEKLEEVHHLIDAMNDKAHAERRAVSA